MEKIEIATKNMLADFDALERSILDYMEMGYKISSWNGCIVAEVPDEYKEKILEKFNFYREPTA